MQTNEFHDLPKIMSFFFYKSTIEFYYFIYSQDKPCIIQQIIVEIILTRSVTYEKLINAYTAYTVG